jgi:hypothetical protein
MPRRANREGSLYRRKDGRWVGSVSLSNGQRKSYYGKTREEVAHKLTSALKDVQDGLPIPSDQLKVGTYLQAYVQRVPNHPGRILSDYKSTRLGLFLLNDRCCFLGIMFAGGCCRH